MGNGSLSNCKGLHEMKIFSSTIAFSLLLAGCLTSPPIDVTIVAGVSDGDACFMRPKPCEIDGFGMTSGDALPIHGFVFIENRSPYPFVIGAEEFSTGYKALEFEVVDGEGVYRISKNDPIWYRNLPEYDVLMPGAKRVLPVCLDSRIWDCGPSSFAIADGIRMRPILRNCFFIVNGRAEWPYRTSKGLIYGSWFYGVGTVRRMVHGKWGECGDDKKHMNQDVLVDVDI